MSKLVSSAQKAHLKELAHKYAHTLKLPVTDFPKRSNHDLNIKDLIPRSSQILYKDQLNKKPVDKDVFILHDGPPYANGDIHIGHAMNKILKDFINRYNLIQGKQIYYKPGWDCHGLPIELKALETIAKKTKKDPSMTLSVQEVRKIARDHATKTISSQLESFKEFAILTDFQHNYKTLNHNFEINQLKIFQKMLEKNLITRQKKPVFWGCETHTALAEGELEYNDQHRSVAAYLNFPLLETTPELQKIIDENGLQNVHALIWTSTPWTIASNKAISINENLEYTFVQTDDSKTLIIADSLSSNILGMKLGMKPTDIKFPGSILSNSKYLHPISNETNPIIHGDHVIDSAGTGLVHTAPGHGNEDYFACLKHGIEAFSPVDQFGKYTNELPKGFETLIGKRVLGEGGKLIWNLFYDKDMVFSKQDDYIHSYPYDWRSKKPIIIRATPQWFANVGKIKDDAKDSLDDVKFVPENGKNRLSAFINNRNEWCISRQRSWGVPIPALYSKSNENVVLLDDVTITHIINKIDELGTDAWFEEESNVSRWLPDSMKDKGDEYYKGKDTMDVWFDSGSSWTEIQDFLQKNGIERDTLADVYLEGSDQHRGWFQSSLLTKIATSDSSRPNAPYKQIVTHGFTLDEKGQKMSKSIGNTISPHDVIKGGNKLPASGVDGLRLWVAQSDYTGDVLVGPTILKHVGVQLKRIRNAFTFMLGNLKDFEKSDSVNYKDLKKIDKYALSKLYDLEKEVNQHYKDLNFNRVTQTIYHHMKTELNAKYFDIIKDRLYADDPNGISRRSAQTVISQILQTYLSILSPLSPVLTQQVWDYSPNWLQDSNNSPFNKGWFKIDEKFHNTEIVDEFANVWLIHNEVNQLMENGRKNDNFGSSLETDIIINGDGKIIEALKQHSDELADYFVVSHVHFQKDVTKDEWSYSNTVNIENESISISVNPSSKAKCPRCWVYSSESVEELCKRCDDVLHEHS
ncbi:isoleucine-trna synthetase [Wickerhamomyces ciferrii]|uniref:isoleucine--tRNA ligase n=1 Tax=Wickerhamomyces ciferrii (strain ATCC 14091 / BCRC 22168 / CBS 111 / JCM 3599 / NBRC 0793 / NRRL Y-1031 F-60-10) TaxID=1206466 RepID=K0KIP1_WICCF|nr:isoleucine-trna synthetase [Wickerhamomyces ciferrii]CCH41033.1 isoleucine-trna synthetase [Wickerhamomyces ciferrii]